MPTLAFLGAGAMGEALMRGLLAAHVYAPHEIVAFDPDAARLQTLSDELGIRVAASAEEVARGADAILLAVKPQILDKALAPLERVLDVSQTVISIAAGISLARLQALFAAQIPLVRVMPNTPCLVGAAASAVSLGEFSGAAQRELAHRVFGAVGLVVDVPETSMDAVTGLSGSGPAYVYVFIEALSDAGVQMGLPRAVAKQLAAQTVLGAAKMALESGQHTGELKDMVTSPGGTTIAGLAALEKRAFRGTVMEAVGAATQRSREMSGS